MKVAVIGASGQLGSDVCRVHRAEGDEVVPLAHEQVEIRDPVSVRDQLALHRPDVIVNAAALTDVDRCETEPELAFAVNALGARNVARAARDAGAYLIHVSTDYVFPGSKGASYTEDDLPHPLSVYGNSKLAGEHFALAEAEKALVVRTCGLYGASPCRGKGSNFVEKILAQAAAGQEIRVVDCETVSPTPTLDLARQILAITREPLWGVCHAASRGSCTWHEFAREILRLSRRRARLTVARPQDMPPRARRPCWSALENARLAKHGRETLRTWQEGLAEYLSLRPR
jgi:dTDP-4-dehydrorhamnose reductase